MRVSRAGRPVLPARAYAALAAHPGALAQALHDIVSRLEREA